MTGSLGVAVTLAEPALGVVKSAGSLIRKEQAPHLFVLLHEQTDLLVLAVAIGVGISAAAQVLLGASQPSACCLVPFFKSASAILQSTCCCCRTQDLRLGVLESSSLAKPD